MSFFLLSALLLLAFGLDSFMYVVTKWNTSLFFFTPWAIIIFIGFRMTIEFFGYSYDLDFIDESYIALHYLDDFLGENKNQEFFLFLISDGMGYSNEKKSIKCPICLEFYEHCENELQKYLENNKSNNINMPKDLKEFYKLDTLNQYKILNSIDISSGYKSPFEKLSSGNDLFVIHKLKIIFVKLEEYLSKNRLKCELHKFPSSIIQFIAILLQGQEDRQQGLKKIMELLYSIKNLLLKRNISQVVIEINQFFFNTIEPKITQSLEKFNMTLETDANIQEILLNRLPFPIDFLPILTIGERLILVKNKFSNAMITLGSLIGALLTILSLFAI
ncbi:MAG: hypothetical protein ACTSR8_09985 [Promethearchaeota archaeon]